MELLRLDSGDACKLSNGHKIKMDMNERRENLTNDSKNAINKYHNEKNIFTFDQNDVVSLSKAVPSGNKAIKRS